MKPAEKGSVRRQTYCHRVRKFHSNGAICVLVWVFFAWTSFIFLGGSSDSTGVHFVGNGLLNIEGADLTLLGREMSVHYACYITVALVWVLGTPLAGWLADVKFGRYKVMQISLWLMWSGLVVHSFLYLIVSDQQLLSTNNVRQILMSVISFSTITVYMFGLVGFLINSVQFGIDQMPDASSAELSTFIRWYTFATCAGIWFPQAVLGLIGSCPTASNQKALSTRSSIVLALLPPLLLSLALLMDSYLRHHLIIEPQSKNPFKLFAGVLKYVASHSQPTNPSAFVYTRKLTSIPNRFDFAKTEYGGPYTTEEVEDVRTLLRIVLLMSPIFLILSCTMLTALNINDFEKELRKCSAISECSQTIISYFGYNYWFVSMVIIVTNEFLVPLVCVRYDCLSCKMLRRIFIGSLIVLALIVVLVGFGVSGHAHPYVTCRNTTNTHCDLKVSYLPIVIPINIAIAVQTILFISGAWEFICAQAPYSMRGLLIGAVWASETIGSVTAYMIKISWYFGSGKGRAIAHSSHVGCGGFYFLSMFFICLLGLVLYCIAACRYRPRMREEAEDQQLLVEEVYAREIDASINRIPIVCEDM